VLFVGGVAVPFIAQAVMAGLGTVLISQLTVGKPVEVSASTGVRTNIVDEARWLWRNPPIRTLTVTVVLVDLTFCALWHMLALSTLPATSMTILFAFGFQGPIWATTATAVRQRSVPKDLQGRVGGVYGVGIFGGLVVGDILGAVISGIWGVLAPFWFGFAGSPLLVVVVWRELSKTTHPDEVASA
jgi:MFS family permease